MDGSNWRWGPDDAPEGEPVQPPPPAAGEGPSGFVILLVVAFLLGASCFLAHRLGDMIWIQNCAIQGRTNCVLINPPAEDRLSK
ncbi:hypothetical protein [Telmatospirillum siberiense]|uniref:Uncharacterized protein n=1 Tax=Telmatospirillum siberiense TaxID=382514 RepID=A0A2N3PUA5_9PROT|nr:hypothetical protein [Telmatospirillum siberiense]PKU23978.1 hypothetical protein CWS72_14030 [Telmatospirillum siberiense]